MGKNTNNSAENYSYHPFNRKLLFLGTAWVEVKEGESEHINDEVNVGTVLRPSDLSSIVSLQLPNKNDHLARGSFLASLVFRDQSKLTLYTPISGFITDVNNNRMVLPSAGNDAYTFVWLARIKPSDLQQEIMECEIHPVIMACGDESRCRLQKAMFEELGCVVRPVYTFYEASTALQENPDSIFVFDADSYGFNGPVFFTQLLTRFHSAKIVVCNSQHPFQDKIYRQKDLFYYTSSSLTHEEVASLVFSAFFYEKHSKSNKKNGVCRDGFNKLWITNSNRELVTLIVDGGVLHSSEGIGFHCLKSLSNTCSPISICLTSNGSPHHSSPQEMLNELNKSDRVLMVRIKDIKQQPGTLIKRTYSNLLQKIGIPEKSITVLDLQPNPERTHELEFDQSISNKVAQHIVTEMITT